MACASSGLSAPAIHHADLDAGFLITEDFGRESFVEGEPPRPIAERYEAATDMLAALHRDALARDSAADAADHLPDSCFRHRRDAGRNRTDARMVSAGSRRRAAETQRAKSS